MVMPFGLCNAPATFQCFMEEVLEPFRPFVAGLLDVVAIWADAIAELHQRLVLVLDRFVKYGLISNSALKDRPMPTTTTKICGFVNAAGYLRPFIKDFSILAGPLTDQSIGPKNKAVTLTKESAESWRAIKNALISSPLVRKFDWHLPIVLETDASQKFLGAALLQPHTHLLQNSNRSILHPIAYFSRKLNETQQRYSAQERELL